MRSIVWVALGGAVGASLRYAVWMLLHRGSDGGFPHGTLVVNVVGCFVLGGLLVHSANSDLSPAAKLFWTTGVCGALTTFSTFSTDTLGLIEREQVSAALLNVFLNLVLGFGAAILGGWLVTGR